MLLILFIFTITSSALGSNYDQRPVFHITPEEGHWLNDPNGPMLFNGLYHLFFQYNPYDSVWGNMSWAHVVSEDLVHWKRLSVALYNDEDYDINGVFSGSAAIDEQHNEPYLFYTCVDQENLQLQCVAKRNTSSPSYETTLEDWEKVTENAIIAHQPSDDWDALNFRDPTLWMTKDEEDIWNMITAASYNNDGVIALYTSSASNAFPINWTYTATASNAAFWDSSLEDAGYHTWMVECPDFFQANPSASFQANTDDLYVLKYSIMETRQEYYEIGKYVNDGTGSSFVRDVSFFDPSRASSIRSPLSPELQNVKETSGDGLYPALLLDYGPHNTFYASKTFYDDAKEERVLWGWSPEQDAEEYTSERDWQGVQSLPRTIAFDTDAKILRTRPVSAIKDLRSKVLYKFPDENSAHQNSISLDKNLMKNGAVTMKKLPASGLQLEINAKFTASASCTSVADLNGMEFGIATRISDDNTNYTKHGFAISTVTSNSPDDQSTMTGTFVSAILDSSASGGSTPTQMVNQVIPGQWNIENMFTDAKDGLFSFDMQLFIDHSMTEMFLQDGALAATMRVYPSEDAQDIAWYTNGEVDEKTCSVDLAEITVYSMSTIWTES